MKTKSDANMDRMSLKGSLPPIISSLIYGLYTITWYVGALHLGGSSHVYVLLLLAGLAVGGYLGATVRLEDLGKAVSLLTTALGASGLLIFLVGGWSYGFYLLAFVTSIMAGAILGIFLRSASAGDKVQEYGLSLVMTATAIGITAAPFLIPVFGMMRVAVFGTIAGFIAAILFRVKSPSLDKSPMDVRIYLPVFISGLMAGTLFTAWTRFLVPVIGPSVYSFSMVGAAILLGMGAGVAAKVAIPFLERDDDRMYFNIHGLLGVWALVSLPVMGRMDHLYIFIRNSQETFISFWALLFLSLFVVFLVPAGLFGVGLQTASRGFGKSSPGFILPVSILGGVLGYVISHYLVFPLLGGVMAVPLAVLMVGGIGYLVLPDEKIKIATGSVAAALVLGLLVFNYNVGAYHTGVGVYQLHPMMNSSGYNRILSAAVPVYRDEGPSGFAVVTDTGGVQTYWLDGYPVGIKDGLSEGYYLAMIPIVLHPDPERVLVAGVGDGGSIIAAEDFGMVVDAVDSNPIYGSLEEAGYAFGLAGIETKAPREVQGRYDIIVSGPIPSWRPEYSGLYTLEYYEEVKDNMAEGGIFCQSLPVWAISDADLFTYLKTLGSAFPEVMVFNSGSMWIVVGSEDPIVWDYREMVNRIEDSGAVARFENTREDIAEQVIGSYVLGDEMLEDLEAVVSTDDKPALGFALTRTAAYPPINGSYRALLDLVGPQPPYLVRPPLAGMVSIEDGHARVYHLGVEFVIGSGWEEDFAGYQFQVSGAPHYFTQFAKRASFVKGEDYMNIQQTSHPPSEIQGALQQMFQLTSYSIEVDEQIIVGENYAGHIVEGRAPVGVRSSVVVGWSCPGNSVTYMLAVDYMQLRPDIDSIVETLKCAEK